VHFRDLRPPTRRPGSRRLDQLPGAMVGGFLKVEPPVFSRIGCAFSRCFALRSSRTYHFRRGEAPRKRAEVKMTEASTPLLR